MRNLALILLLISLLCFNVHSQWVQQTSGINSVLYSIHFINPNTGWMTGTNSAIIKTTNGGQNWFTQPTSLPLDRELNDIYMVNADTGYIGGWSSTFLKTTNGGTNWVTLPNAPTNYASINAVHFINANTGWACAFLGVIWKTTNGGITWDSLSSGTSGPLRDIQFLNALTGWVCGDGGIIRKTTDGGLNWFFQFFGTTSDFSYNSMHFVNLNTGYVVGRYFSGVFRTTNGGNNWDTVALIPNVRCLYFTNSSTGWVGGMNGLLYKTTNSGNNWLQQNIPLSGLFNDIYFITDTVGWAINFATILKTTNGGTYVGLGVTNNLTLYAYKLQQNYPNPFNPITKIRFDIPNSALVKVSIFDILGNELKILHFGVTPQGQYEIMWDASNFSSGIYFCKLTAGYYTETIKMNLIQ